jgi:hypothetical protein
MSFNFLQQFASMDIGVNNSVVNDDSKTIKNEKLQKNVKNVKTEKNIKKNGFVHGINVVMKTGEYKGYDGFVYECLPEKVNLMLKNYSYVFIKDYKDKKIGDKLNLNGDKIVSKIDVLYKVLIEGETVQEINLPMDNFVRFVFFMNGKVTRVGQILKVYDTSYEVVMMEIEHFGMPKDVMKMLSDGLLNDKIYNMYGEKNFVMKKECFDEYYMVCKRSDKSEVDYFAKYGKVCLEIPEQYLVVNEKFLSVSRSMVKIDGKRVKVKSGIYRNSEGELVDIQEASLEVSINALCKVISNHFVYLNGYCAERKIYVSDVFYKDLLLKNGNYFEVKEWYDDCISGVEKIGATYVEKIIKITDINMAMSGFMVIYNTDTQKCSFEKEDTNSQVLCDEILPCNSDNNNGDEIDIDNECDDYGDHSDNVVLNADDYVFDSNEGQMKESFKDFERAGFSDKKFSKDEKEYMKMIEKCSAIIGETTEKYSLLDKVVDAVNTLKSELEKISVSEWKSTDVKYLVASLFVYEMIKNGYNVTIYDFRKYVSKLYDSGYMTKSSIMDSVYTNVYENVDETSCWKLIETSREDKKALKMLYKNGKYTEIMKDMMERCFKLLNHWFGKVCFSIDDCKLEWIPVSKPNNVRQYPKYFLTTEDVINNRQVETANKIIWTPESEKLIRNLKSSLNDRLEKEDKDLSKLIYKFVIDNIDNAPFVLKRLENSDDKLDKLKCRELKKTFDIVSSKLKTFVEKKNMEKNNSLQTIMEEKESLMKRREIICAKRYCGDYEDLSNKIVKLTV